MANSWQRKADIDAHSSPVGAYRLHLGASLLEIPRKRIAVVEGCVDGLLHLTKIHVCRLHPGTEASFPRNGTVCGLVGRSGSRGTRIVRLAATVGHKRALPRGAGGGECTSFTRMECL